MIIRSMTLKQQAYLALLLLVIVSNATLFFLLSNFGLMQHPHGVDRKANGNTLISTLSSGEFLNFFFAVKSGINASVTPNNAEHKIFEVDQNGNTIWEFTGLSFPHEVLELPNGHLLIADTGYDRVIEINYPNKDIVWEWKPELINWTKVNPSWGSDHYYNSKIAFDWTHLNDVDFKQYETWNACLVSIRNFDLVVEINYTAEKIGSPNNPNNIVWFYGEYNNKELLNRQHNPDYLSNGNIIIADSGNNRIIEVNYTTRERVWQYEGGLDWPRDATELPNGNILITDSENNRIFEVNKVSKETIWTFKGELTLPYEAEILENGNILVSSSLNGIVYEINKDGIVVWRYGISYIKSVIYLNFITLIMTELANVGFIYKRWKTDNLTHKEKKNTVVFMGIHSAIIIFSIIILFTFQSIVVMIVSALR
ncbi:MAG: aryl-sulfate sulfotransferase [Promethearchaeota archaeon]